MVSYLEDNIVNHISVNACLAPLCSLHGMAVTTVEGIGSTKSKLHQVQQRIADAHGSQCGFCTPGMVMSMYTLLRNNPQPKMEDIETYFQGNLCRCTGYRAIIEGYTVFARDTSEKSPCGMGDKCCKKMGPLDNGTESNFKPYDSSQEPIFPPELTLRSNQMHQQNLVFKSENMIWYRPTSLSELLRLKETHPNAKLVVGNTELGIEMKFKKMEYPVMIQPNRVPELSKISVSDKGICAGASVTLSQLERVIGNQPQDHRIRIGRQIVEMLRWFAGKQIRNVGSLGGNIMTGSPISDLNPIFMASNCTLTLASQNKTRTVKLDQHFYTGYRKTLVEPHEVLVNITIPFTQENEHFVAFKQARRRDDDIAIVNGAFFYSLDNERKISEARMAFGGLSFVTKMAIKTADHLKGKSWSQQTFEEAMNILLEGMQLYINIIKKINVFYNSEFPLPPNVPGAMVRYRQTLAMSLFFKSYLSLSESSMLDPRELSATQVFHKEPLRGSQLFEIVPENQKDHDPLRRPLKHSSADKQATGEAVYVDDIPKLENELYGGFVISQKAHAKLLDIDASPALEMKGVHGFYSYRDIDPKNNIYRMIYETDEWVFADGIVHCVGQIIGIVVADNQELALKAAHKVKVTYEVLKPIVTIDEAIEANSFLPLFGPRIKATADVEKDLAQSHHLIKGELRSGAQEHFYMETQSCLAIPTTEDGEMIVYAATQNPTEAQRLVAHALDVPMNRVVTRVKRVGGGFGGKETRCMPLVMATAFAASKVNRSVRVSLDRDLDMMMCGQRHPFYSKYRLGVDQEGRLEALDVDLYCNAGYSLDLSFAVIHRAMLHMDNAYNIQNVDVRGYCCKTNIQSNTAFRGFGGPQGLLVVENFMDQAAIQLGMDPIELREKNLYKTGDRTYFSQVLDHCTIQRCWEECKEQSQFEAQKKAVQSFNEQNKWKKRGISMIPCKFGIAFTGAHMNQGGALVQVYTDGSVLLTHGGTEMGQGLYVKTMQVASKVLDIPMEMIHISETSTDKVPNTSPTAASTGTDLNGMAVKKACEEILRRLEPIRARLPDKSWKDWIVAAYRDRISLSATGFYATPDIGYNFDQNEGNPFSYYTYGVAASVVEIDCLTGDHTVLKTDIVMDLGESINPAIDIGQIEGAFAQGYGLFMMEQMIHSPDGVLLTRGPGAYKLPGFGDMPTDFNVSLLRGAPNPKAVFSSKAVGEPPLFLAASVFFAVKDAIRWARMERGLSPDFGLDAPATAERIRMACEDHLTDKVAPLPDAKTYKPWGIQL